MAFNRRRLPHIDDRGKAVFITWRLHGSVPTNRAFPEPSAPFHKYGNIFRRHRSLAVAALKGRIVSRDRKGAVWPEYVTELLK
jgi:hypothetical protein